MDSSARRLYCPDDAQLLRELTDGPVHFAHCGRCAGLWFERHAVERAHSDPAGIPSESRRARAAPTRRAIPRQCPGCRTPLLGIVVEGIEIDRCPACRGVWLDPGEYDAVRLRLPASRVPARKSAARDDFVGDVGVDLLDVVLLLGEILF